MLKICNSNQTKNFNQGIRFMRMDPRLIEISDLKIEYDSDLLKAKPGKRIKIPVNVTNYGETVSVLVKHLNLI